MGERAGSSSSSSSSSSIRSNAGSSAGTSTDQVRALVDSLSPRAAHQYRSYCRRYVEWLLERGLVEHEPDELVHYHSLPLNNALVHWHLIETAHALPSVRKAISSLKFLAKLCAVNGAAAAPARVERFSETARAGAARAGQGVAQTALDGKYLEQLATLHEACAGPQSERGECGAGGGGELAATLATVSAHVWAPRSPLPEKYFRNGLERLRFLVDFQWRAYSRLSYEQRAQIRLADLHVTPAGLSFDLAAAHGRDRQQHGREHQPVALLPQRNPLVCPLVALAAYLFLRFRDGGFPQLLGGSSGSGGAWAEMPLIRGKSLLDYPREETLGHYYTAVFRQCRVTYKRREWFGRPALEFPRWRAEDYAFLSAHPAALQQAFPQHVASDFAQALNLYPGDVTCDGLPEELVVQLFPEVERYRERGAGVLSEQAERFLRLMDALRRWLLRALPLLYRLFPDHDLFASAPLNGRGFKAWLQLQPPPAAPEALQAVRAVQAVQGAQAVPELSPTPGAIPAPTAPTAPTADETFRFVQYQTLSNFEILLSLLSGIFDKLEMKKSSREYATRQLALVHDTLRDRIRDSKPEHAVKQESRDSDDEAGDADETELQQMIGELVGRQVETLQARVESQLESRLAQIEARLEARLDARLDAAGLRTGTTSAARLGRKRTAAELDEDQDVGANQDAGADHAGADHAVQTFELDPAIDSVEEVVLEWFTPNPRMGGQCVHSMNKAGSAWRTGCEPLYKLRKAIVEFYIHLVNKRGMDRYDAVQVCERLRGEGDLRGLAETLRAWKKTHESFDGLGDGLGASV